MQGKSPVYFIDKWRITTFGKDNFTPLIAVEWDWDIVPYKTRIMEYIEFNPKFHYSPISQQEIHCCKYSSILL